MNRVLIERLKNKDYVRAFSVMSKEEQECYKEVGKENLTVLMLQEKEAGCNWIDLYKDVEELPALTYAIKPDYQPEHKFKLGDSVKIIASEALSCFPPSRLIGRIVKIEKVDNSIVPYLVSIDDLSYWCKESTLELVTGPEYEDVDITVNQDGFLGCQVKGKINHWMRLYKVVCMANFEGFYVEGEVTRNLIDYVATKIRQGKNVVARFRR